jgi:hypothetical protein
MSNLLMMKSHNLFLIYLMTFDLFFHRASNEIKILSLPKSETIC